MQGSIIWCARVRHDVEDSRSDVIRAIANVRRPRSNVRTFNADGVEIQPDPLLEPPGFIFVTPIGAPTQRLLSVDHISSVEAIPGSGV